MSVATYRSWKAMHVRCLDDNSKDFKYYGGRGVFMDFRWLSIDAFRKDMGRRPPETTLGRRDNEAGYFPWNTEWQGKVEQNRNKRRQKNNSTGLSGVSIGKSGWLVHFHSEYVGYFSDFFEACCKRKSLEQGELK